MDSFETNKIIGAVLATCLVLLSTSFAAGALFSPAKPAKPGFEIAVKEEAPAGGKEAAPAPSEPIEKLLQTASVEKGEAAAKKCGVTPARVSQLRLWLKESWEGFQCEAEEGQARVAAA